jgi:hypothetical protein
MGPRRTHPASSKSVIKAMDWRRTVAAPLPAQPVLADPDVLRAFALAYQVELKTTQVAVQLRTLEIEKLQFQIAELQLMQFDRSSERITRQIEQLALQLQEQEIDEPEDINSEDRPHPLSECGAQTIAGPTAAAVML